MNGGKNAELLSAVVDAAVLDVLCQALHDDAQEISRMRVVIKDSLPIRLFAVDTAQLPYTAHLPSPGCCVVHGSWAALTKMNQ